MTAEPYVCPRCGETRPEPFTWGHRPNAESPIAGQRTCGTDPVPASQVEQVRREKNAEVNRVLLEVARAEAGW